MDIFRNYLLENGVDEKNIIAINFEDYDFFDLRDPHLLYTYIKERLEPIKKIIFFLMKFNMLKIFQESLIAYILKIIQIFISQVLMLTCYLVKLRL